ncbi:MAG: ATP-binding cassette domain-containing protein, partial [Gemmatimonadetes bacterium]|nr:ATP-binding cassette domain-containing protein [Gemmatimonadota bacterium]
MRDLRHGYGGRVVLEIGELDLEAGVATALVGPNGSGKSTLLRILAFVDPPSRGSLRLDGQPVATGAQRHAARQIVTLVEQRPFLFRGTVARNVSYALRVRGVEGTEATRRA